MDTALVILGLIVVYGTLSVEVNDIKHMLATDWRGSIRRLEWWAAHMTTDDRERVSLQQAQMLYAAAENIVQAVAARNLAADEARRDRSHKL